MDSFSKKIVKNAFEAIILLGHAKRLDKKRYQMIVGTEPFKSINAIWKETQKEYNAEFRSAKARIRSK